MTDDLNGKTLLIGAASPPLLVTFSRGENEALLNPEDRTDYTNADIELRIFPQDKKGVPSSAIPTLTLSVGSGLARGTNGPTATVVTAQLSSANLATLIGTAEAARFGYVWAIRPVGAADYYRAFLGQEFDGDFVVAKQGYGGADSVRVA